MFERFTETAIHVIMLAQEEARRLSHNFVGTEQMLIGILGNNRTAAAMLLKQAGLNLKDARAEEEKIIGRGKDVIGIEIPFTAAAKRALELSWDAAKRLRHEFISPEHLLLGILRQGDGVACRILENLHVDRTKLESEITQTISSAFAGTFANVPLSPSFQTFPINTEELFKPIAQMQQPFNWYEENATLTLQRAGGIAETFGSKEINPEHLMLAVLRDDTNIFQALKSNSLSLSQIRDRLIKSIEPDDGKPTTSLPFSATSQKALQEAWNLAAQYKQSLITKEAIFLGILGQPDGSVAKVLQELNVDMPKLKQPIIQAFEKIEERSKAIQSAEMQKALEFSKKRANYGNYVGTKNFDVLALILGSSAVIGVLVLTSFVSFFIYILVGLDSYGSSGIIRPAIVILLSFALAIIALFALYRLQQKARRH